MLMWKMTADKVYSRPVSECLIWDQVHLQVLKLTSSDRLEVLTAVQIVDFHFWKELLTVIGAIKHSHNAEYQGV